MEARLQILRENAGPIRFPLTGHPLTLGRSPFNDLTFDEEGIARKQCELSPTENGYRLIDRSGKGTQINGVAKESHDLRENDRISFGSITLCFTMDVRSAETESGPRDGTSVLSDNSPGPARATLRWKEGKQRQRFPLRGPVLVGSGEEAHVRPDDEFLSRRHCQFVPTDTGVWLRDLGSTNGTWIGDIRVGEVRLPEKCTIRVGRTDLEFSGEKPGETIGSSESFFGMVGNHPAMIHLQNRIKRAAPLSEAVLLLGETGVGKELAARALHRLSGRKGAFIPVNCGAIASELMESELFGHEKGAFTGASAHRKGAFAAADGGTIFLDEIGELPLSLQPKLLRVLDHGEIKAVGSDTVKHADARIIAATHRNPEEMVQRGEFRKDLYFRLFILPITLPPLRERRDDIPLLAAYFTSQAGSSATFSNEALDALRYYYWPGNVRELRNTITATLCHHAEEAAKGPLREEHLCLQGPGALLSMASQAESGKYSGQTLQEMEVELIREALNHYDGNKRAVSRALGISKTALYDKLRRHGIEG